jgi:hypothetical protein
MEQKPEVSAAQQSESASTGNGSTGPPDHGWHRVNASGTAVIGFFTIVLAVLAGMQYCQMRAANKLSAKINQPFVYIANVQATYYSGQGAVIQPIWTNSGNTPTVDLSIYSSTKTFIGVLPKNYNFPDLDARGEEVIDPHLLHQTLLPPKGAIPSRDMGVFDKDQMDAVNKLAVNLYVWGWAKYRDRFDREKSHITRFCVQVMRFIPPTNEQLNSGVPGFGGALQWSFCDQGNCADEECEKQ